MSEVQKTAIEMAKEEVLAAFDDGFQINDIIKCAEVSLRLASNLGNVTEDELVEASTALVNHVIDKSDTPWLPDNLSDPIMKLMVPGLIRSLIQAANGRLQFLKAKEASPPAGA